MKLLQSLLIVTHAATALIVMESEIFSISDTCAAAVRFPVIVSLFTVVIFSCALSIFNANYLRIKLLMFN